MATKTKTQVGGFTWILGSTFQAEDVEPEPFIDTCFTCPRPVTETHGYWYCAENAELVHTGCRIPNFDHE